MICQDCKTLERRFIQEVINEGALERVGQYYASNADKVKLEISKFQQAFAGYYITIEEQIGEGCKVVTWWTARGRHTGEVFGLPPTGREARWAGVTINRYSDGKVIEHWVIFDKSEIMRQLGGSPEPLRAK